MVSVASDGSADRIAARILIKVLRAGSGTPARYSSTLLGALSPFAAEPRLADFDFFMRAMLREALIQVHSPDNILSEHPALSAVCRPPFANNAKDGAPSVG